MTLGILNYFPHVFLLSGAGLEQPVHLLTLFYVEVTDQQRVSKGGGNPEEGELIEVVDVPVTEAQKFALDETINRPATFSLSLLWFEQYKKNPK